MVVCGTVVESAKFLQLYMTSLKTMVNNRRKMYNLTDVKSTFCSSVGLYICDMSHQRKNNLLRYLMVASVQVRIDQY